MTEILTEIIVNKHTVNLAKRRAKITLLECRQDILNAIKKFKGEEQKQFIDILNAGPHPLTEKELEEITP